MSRDMEQWADDHGYARRRCSRCGKVFWTDSDEGCPNGCFEDEDAEPPEKGDGDEEEEALHE